MTWSWTPQLTRLQTYILRYGRKYTVLYFYELQLASIQLMRTLSSESREAHVPSARAPRRRARSKGIEDKDDSSLFRKSYNVLHCPFDIRAGAKAMFARLGTYYGLWYANVFGHMKITKKYNMETIYC